MILPQSTLSESGVQVTANTPKIYSVGTLQYTSRGLFALFAWLLWGDFAFMFFENIFGKFIPLYLKDLKASNALIGAMAGSIAGVVNILFLPSLSQWSDRCRTRWGRRIPFLAAATPVTVLSLIMMGFAPEIGTWLHSRVIQPMAPSASLSVVILTFLCICAVAFHFFNMVLCGGFNWLLRDVVPLEWMGRFLSWFRIVSTVSAVAFNYFVFPYIISHRREICVGVGLFYMVVFLLMCAKVREGDYPPVSAEEPKAGVFNSFAGFFRECFSIALYRHYFYAIILAALGTCSGAFFLLFYRENLGLDMRDMGNFFTAAAVVSALAYLPMGWLCDKFSPIRVAIVAQSGMFAVSILSFFFINDKLSLIIFIIISSIISVGWGLGSATLTMQLFPAEKFGLFSSGTNIFGCGIMIVGNFLVGYFMDLMDSDYRMAYLWSAISGLSLLPLLLVYQGWKRHGGPNCYVPPLRDMD